jgi:hypothetical protein
LFELWSGDRYWCGAVPELATYTSLLRPKNPRSAALSAGNLGAEGFTRLLQRLGASAPRA